MIDHYSQCQYGVRVGGVITTHIKNASPLISVRQEADETGGNASESEHRNREKVGRRCSEPWVPGENGDTSLILAWE